MEKDFIQNDLERYAKADDKEMIGSLNAALLGVAAIKQQLGLVLAIMSSTAWKRLKSNSSRHSLPAAGRLKIS